MPSKTSIEAGRGHVTLATDSTLLEKGLAAASDKFKSWGKGITAMGAGIAASAALITAPFLVALSVFSEWGADVTRASRLTGIGFEEIQRAAASLRTDMDGLVGGVSHMNQFLADLAHGSAEAAQAVQELGLDAAELLGPMSEEERLRRFTEAIAGIGDDAQRSALAIRSLGRNTRTMDFSGGVQGLHQREARAQEVGGVMSAADGALIKEYNKSLAEMKLSLRALWTSIGAAAAPAMKEFFDLLTRVYIAVREWTNANRPLLEIIFRVADKVAMAGAAIAVLGGIVYGASYAVRFLQGMLTILRVGLIAKAVALLIAKVAVLAYSAVMAVCTFVIGLFTGASWGMLVPIALIGAAFAIAAAAVYGLAIALQGASVSDIVGDWGTQISAFGELFAVTWGGISDAITAGDWSLAFNVAWAGVIAAWTRGVNWIREIWFVWSTAFLNTWDELSGAAAHAMQNIASIVTGIFADVSNSIENTFIDIVAAIAAQINRLIAMIPRIVRNRLGVTPIAFDGDAARQAAERRQAAEARQRGIDDAANHMNIDDGNNRAAGDRVQGVVDERNRANVENAAADAVAGIFAEDAMIARMQREMEAIADGAGVRKKGFTDDEKVKYSVSGGFSAQQAFGFDQGGTRELDPMKQLVKIEEQSRDILAEQRNLLRRIEANGAARFA